ncbi:MAG: CHAT domain-containing protein [Candidatus Promineifilaceae bacterium]
MTPQETVEVLIAGDPITRIDAPKLVQTQLKTIARQTVRQNVAAANEVVQAAYRFADLVSADWSRSFALTLAANVQLLAVGNYEQAIGLFDKAAALAETPLDRAVIQVGTIAALLHQGAFDKAVQLGDLIAPILEQHGANEQLAGMLNNLALGMHIRQGNDALALEHFERAAALLDPSHPYYALIQMNHSVPLRHLGRFAASLHFSTTAYDQLMAQGATAEAIRAHQNVAMTYFTLGNYNEALRLFDEVRQFWLADGRERDALVVELFVSDGLFQLYRYGDVITRCEQAIEGLATRQLPGELAQAWLLLARAYAAIGRTADALAAVEHVTQLFAEINNQHGQQVAQLERAAILLQQGKQSQAAMLAASLVAPLGEQIMLQMRAKLIVAAANLADSATEGHLERVIACAKSAELSGVLYRAYALLGDWHSQHGQPLAALKRYESALEIIELLKGRLMVEFRISFADGAFDIYEKATALCIEQKAYVMALDLAERAKSRALLDMIAHRLDLSIQARQPTDEPLVRELLALRKKRDQLYRQLGSRDDLRLSTIVSTTPALAGVQQQIQQYEAQITALWHQLLIRNADYTRESALWQVQTQRPQLDADTLLIEYFTLQDRFVVFLVSAETVDVIQLEVTSKMVERWLQFFKINCQRAVPNRHSPKLYRALTAQAVQFLQNLYSQLIAPIRSRLTHYPNLIIVPHDMLHHVPFHALHDGTCFLHEAHVVSYLPSATLFTPARRRSSIGRFVAFGYSNADQLPHTVQEAKKLAVMMEGVAFTEADATLERVRKVAEEVDILHLATHGEFNAKNTLFSGLLLHDGQLVTLDVFGLNLNADLVTLSACQTGQAAVSQGNELLGLMRGFLSAGAASLLLTHWSVEDESTEKLMMGFYRYIRAGMSKAAALQKIQREWANGAVPTLEHPYFWASFFLVGNTG